MLLGAVEVMGIRRLGDSYEFPFPRDVHTHTMYHNILRKRQRIRGHPWEGLAGLLGLGMWVGDTHSHWKPVSHTIGARRKDN